MIRLRANSEGNCVMMDVTSIKLRHTMPDTIWSTVECES
jgi:hypothetical protein